MSELIIPESWRSCGNCGAKAIVNGRIMKGCEDTIAMVITMKCQACGNQERHVDKDLVTLGNNP